MNTIYVYTTKSQSLRTRAESGEEFPVRLKVGQTQQSADERIRQQDSTSNSEPLIKLWSKSVPDHVTDKSLHRALERRGLVKSREGEAEREWFDFPDATAHDALNRVKTTLQAMLTGVEALNDWPSMPYQEDIIEWAVEQYQSQQDLLLNAIMRAGKCHITYEIARALGVQRLLVVTAKVGVNDSWQALLPGGEESHVNYGSWHYHNYKRVKKLELGHDVDVVFVSLQYINKHWDRPTPLLKQILATSWDLVAFDEQHYATTTDNTQRLWDTLTWDRKLELSGTPYKTVLSGRYEQGSIYNFDYVAEQQQRRRALKSEGVLADAFRYRADINYAMVTVPEKVKNLLGEDGFTFPKLWATEEGEFRNVMAVNEFLTFAVQTYKRPPRRFAKVADSVSRHSLWILPNDVAAIGALERQLKAHPFFGKRRIINASGRGVKDIETVKRLIAKNDSDGGAGTITLTCGRFLEGTSVPEWWSVHQMNNDKSAADYFQGSFRCKTPWAQGKKESVVVYDYAPERFVSVVYQHCEQVSIVENRPVDKIIAEWLDVSEVYDYDGNQWTLLTGADISNRFLSDINNYMDRVGQAVQRAAITDEITALLADKNKDSNGVTASSQLNGNDIETGTNKRRTKKSATTDKEERDPDELEETVQRIRYALKQVYELSKVAWANGSEINTLADVVNCEDREMVVDITGLAPDEWQAIMPAVDVTRMNRAIGQYNAL